MPAFVTFNSLFQTFAIKPTNPATDLGMFIVKGTMSDSRLSTDFDFKIEVSNNPPHLKEKLADQSV
jgi:hypothetical protein